MSRRERRQRLILENDPISNVEPFPAEDEANIEEHFTKLIEDIERIKTGPIVPLHHTVLDEVDNAPGWVRVSRKPQITSTTSTPAHYYWHPASGELSWTTPVGQDPVKSLEMTRTIISDAVERLEKEAETTPSVPPAAQKVIQASALLKFLDILAKEQHSREKMMGIHTSKVWCTVHACIASAVAEIGAAPATAPPPPAAPPREVIDGRKALAAAAAAAAAILIKNRNTNNDDMDIEEEETEKGQQLNQNKPTLTAATATAVSTQQAQAPAVSLPGVKLTKKATKTKSSKLAGGNKSTSAMISKWASVQKELKEDDASENELELQGDAREAFLERKRLLQAEEWRTEQIRTGAVDGNSNFAPVMGDWRNRVKKQKNESDSLLHSQKEDGEGDGEKKISTNEEPVAPLSAENDVDVDALSVGLPQGWRAILDASTGKVYYGNLQTQSTQWERPS